MPQDTNAPSNAFLRTVGPARKFIEDASRLLRKCSKPDARELKQTAYATGLGLLVMGFVGYFVKLVHIPINNIIIGA